MKPCMPGAGHTLGGRRLAVLLPLERFFIRSDRYPVLPGLAWIVVECVLFALVYIGALRLISPTSTDPYVTSSDVLWRRSRASPASW